jgi:hypothetical protein
MIKAIVYIVVFTFFEAIVIACPIAVGITGSGLYSSAPKCYGTIDTYNAMTNRNGFYYNYEYWGFPGGGVNGIACETPVTNTDAVQFFGRNRNWGNNGACLSCAACCPGPLPGDDTVYASWGTGATSNNYLVYLIMESCPCGDGFKYQCDGTGLPARVAGVSCGGVTTGVDAQFHPAAPIISSVTRDPCVPSAGCTLNIAIAGPTAGNGLYGSDGVSMISGYRIYTYTAPLGSADPGGAIGGWTATDNYIPYTGANSSASFSFTWADTDTLWIGYLPIFNNRANTDIAVLADNGMHPTGYLAGGWAKFQPTAVVFESFTARYADMQTVGLNWATASENDSMGFNLYRSPDASAWTKVNPTLIQAMGQGGGGAVYAYTDNLPKQRTFQSWKYKVEEINNGGIPTTEATTEVTR